MENFSYLTSYIHRCRCTAYDLIQHLINNYHVSDKMAAAIEVVPHFYWSHCLVCHKEQTPSAPLLRCSRCHTAPYCSPTHQRSHWKEHKQLCSYMSESAEEGQHSVFSHMVGSSQEGWSEFITSSVSLCSFFLAF